MSWLKRLRRRPRPRREGLFLLRTLTTGNGVYVHRDDVEQLVRVIWQPEGPLSAEIVAVFNAIADQFPASGDVPNTVGARVNDLLKAARAQERDRLAGQN